MGPARLVALIAAALSMVGINVFLVGVALGWEARGQMALVGFAIFWGCVASGAAATVKKRGD